MRMRRKREGLRGRGRGREGRKREGLRDIKAFVRCSRGVVAGACHLLREHALGDAGIVGKVGHCRVQLTVREVAVSVGIHCIERLPGVLRGFYWEIRGRPDVVAVVGASRERKVEV